MSPVGRPDVLAGDEFPFVIAVVPRVDLSVGVASPDELHGWLDQIGKDGSTFVYASYAPLPEKTLRRERNRLESISTEEVCGMRLFTYRVVSPPP